MKDLGAESLMHDPRVVEAKRLLLAALIDHQRKVAGPRPADPGREASYAQLLRDFADVRGGPLYYPYLGSGFGRGCLVELADGSVKYDMISGIGVHGLGHAHPAVVSACLDAALQDTVMQGNLQQNVESALLSRELLDVAAEGSKLAHCFLSSSGAMANENALKILLQKKSPASRVLAFNHAFAGRTLALAQITDKASYREGLPVTLAADYVPFYDAADPEGSTRRAVDALKQHLHRYPRQHAAMCLELAQGEGGYYTAEPSFFRALLDVLRANGVAVWFDEVQTFGRGTTPFAFQALGLGEFADVVTVGKLTQVCATLFTGEFKPRPGLVSQTFTAGTSALYAARAILRELTGGGYFGPEGKNARLRAHFVRRLEGIADRHPAWVRGPFGFGTMIAFTLFGGEAGRTKDLLMELFRAGVVAFVAGDNPARIRFLPPAGAATAADVDAVCDILEAVMGRMAS